MSLTSRACIACYGFAVAFTGLSTRLIYLAVNRHEHYATQAKDNYRKRITIPAQRGTIQDANGAMLATNEPLKNVIADCSLLIFEKKEGKETRHIDQREKVAAILAEPLGISEAELLSKLTPPRRYAVLKKKITEDEADVIEAVLEKAEIKGVRYEQDFERIYPAHQLLSHVVGFYGYEEERNKEDIVTGGKFRGIEGLERTMESWLAGQEGWRYSEKDGRGRELPSYRAEERDAHNGADVRLTIDLTLQQIVETALEEACNRLKPKHATVIMMRPETGEILAMANRPCYDPNEPGKAQPEQRFNHAVAGIYEPGSTFKAITCAGSIDAGLATLSRVVFCDNGKALFGGKYLHDHHSYGDLTVAEIIEKSSNIGAAHLATQMGVEHFYKVIHDFGFGQMTGLPIPGESSGILHPPRSWTATSISHVAMGHEVAATPLQVITATCAIANGGNLMMPQLIKDIRDDKGESLAEFKPQIVRGGIIKPKTANDVTQALIRVTGKKGTAYRAHIPGFQIAGKTGTAQKIEDGHYSKLHHITTFVGYVPAHKPAFCMLVLFDQTRLGEHEDVGGITAAPVFKTIAEQSLAYMGYEPDPAIILQDKEDAKNLARNER